MNNLMEEATHWQSLKSGDINALQELYNHHVQGLYNYGMVLCQDPERVKDCIHDLFLFCWTNREGLTIPTSGKAYLMVSLRRRLFDKGPKSSLVTTVLEDGEAGLEVTDNPEENWIHAEDEAEKQQKLANALALLSERQREIIHMKYFQQMDYEDIGKVMELNYQSARNLVNRALMALRREMIAMAMIILALM